MTNGSARPEAPGSHHADGASQDPLPRQLNGGRDGEEPGESSGPGRSFLEDLFGQAKRVWTSTGLGASSDGAGSHMESIAEILKEFADEETPMTPEERFMLLNLLRFRTLRVSDVMVPRVDIVAVEMGMAFDDLMAVFRDAGHSRLPVYRETLDDPVGMVHIKDVFACLVPGTPADDTDAQTGAAGPADPEASAEEAGKGEATGNGKPSLAKLKREILFVPPSMPALDLLLQMQAQRMHMALVIDEYGGTDGLISIEDLVEMIVGEIEDEHDTVDESGCTALEDGAYLVDARMEIEEFERDTGLDLRYNESEEDEVDTLGGLVFSLAGRVPRRGEIIRHPGGFDLVIVEADPRRIRRLRVSPNSAQETARAGQSRQAPDTRQS